jgi:flagellar motor switch protein FliG
MQPAGPETARELLEKTLDREEVEPAQQRIDDQVLAGPFAYLHDRQADEIRRLIQEEHPQTIALVSAQISPSVAAQILAGFDAAKQADILGRVARLGPTDPEVLEEIALSLRDRLGRIPIRRGGVSRSAEVLRHVNRSASRGILDLIEPKDVHLAQTLRETLFSFKDLASLNDATIALILQQTDHLRWAVALKGCSEPLRQRVFSNLTAQVARALKDEIQSMGPVRLSEITSVQQQIAEAVLTMESEDQIDLSISTRQS